mgnify:CR=1 FL=1
MKQSDVADVAEAVVTAKRKGADSINIGRVTFTLHDTGLCARFVRECHEAVLGLAEYAWSYAAANAIGMEAKLKAAGLAVAPPRRGDVVAFNRGSGVNGHIAIYLGNGQVAENTISGKRGNPLVAGHKITPLASIGEARVTGYYRPLPIVDTSPVAQHEFEVAWRWAKDYGIVNTVDYDPTIGRMLEILREKEFIIGLLLCF